MSREQDASKAKENLNNLDTKALGREVISSCASGYLRGVVVAILVRTINANSNEFENGCHLKQAKDTKTGVASTADSVSMFMKKYWSRRSSRENNAGLACGHEQVKRVESADAAQRRGTVECPRLACTQCAQMDETENVLQHEYSTGHRPKLARQVALNAATEHGETTVRQELIAHLYCLNRRRARGTQRRGGVRRFTCLVRTSFFWWRLVMF